MESEIIRKTKNTLYQNLLMKYRNANASRTRTKQLPELLYKVGVLKKFVLFTGNHLNHLIVFSYEYSEILKTAFLKTILRTAASD